jgi:hypothetical protein
MLAFSAGRCYACLNDERTPHDKLIECEGELYEDATALIAYATENFRDFIIDSDAELVEVRYEDGNLVIEYKTVDDYDADDNPIIKTVKDEFEITPKYLMVKVPSFL